MFRDMFDKDDISVFEFDNTIKENYLKIISNIFYFNIRKAQKKFKNDYVSKSNEFRLMPVNELNKKFNDLYKHFLKQTRNEIIQFFNLPQNENLSFKILLRIYPFFFSPYSPFRMEYDKINRLVNQLIAKIAEDEKHCIDELYYDNHVDAITSPKNVIKNNF
jgi:transcriptional regulator of heat shock response